jgi:hypothetical protein
LTDIILLAAITDMCERSTIYFELFEWLETISNHEALCSAMAMPTMVRVSSVPREANKSERTVLYEGSAGPRELMENLVIQAGAAKKGFESTSTRKKTKEELELEMTEEMKRMSEAERDEMRNKKGKEKATVAVGEEGEELSEAAKMENGQLIDFW